MNVLWQDNVPSFLDGSSLGGTGAFAASFRDGGAPWFASGDGGLFTDQPVLWWNNGADTPTGASGLTVVTAFDSGDTAGGWLSTGVETFSGRSLTDGGLLWPDSGSTSGWLPTNAGAGRFDSSAVEATSVLWLQSMGDFAGGTEPSTVLWTGDAGQPSLVTADSLHLAGSMAGPAFPTLAPEHLVWADPSTATGLIAGPTLIDAAPGAAMSGAGAAAQLLSGLPISGAGSQP